MGGGFGGLAQVLLSPTSYSVTAPAAYALVGVAGMLAANCQVPLTAVLLLFELTHDYFIIVSLSSALLAFKPKWYIHYAQETPCAGSIPY